MISPELVALARWRGYFPGLVRSRAYRLIREDQVSPPGWIRHEHATTCVRRWAPGWHGNVLTQEMKA